MTNVTVRAEVAASPEEVFHAVTDVEHFPDYDPDVISVEFLSETKSGAGTRFRETRRMGKREMQNDLEITEFEPPRRARFVCDTHGTVWDTTYRVEPNGGAGGGGSVLELSMDARAHKLLPKLMNPLMKGMFRRGMQKYVDAVAARFRA